MAFEPVYSDLSPSCPAVIAAGQAVIEAKLLPTGFTVAKVLSASADVTVRSGEVFTGEARYSGKAYFRVLVLDSDGICRSLDYVAEFSDKLTGEDITSQTKPTLVCCVLDTDIVVATEHEIKLACVAEVKLIACRAQSLRCLTAGGDGIYTHDDRLDYARQSAAGCESSLHSDTVSINADEILFCEPRCCILRRTVSADVVSVEGIVINDITARSGDTVVSVSHETPFNASFAAPGAHGGDILTCSAQIESCKAELVTGENATVALDYNIEVCYQTFTEDVCNPVTDAFSVTNELNINGKSVTVSAPMCDETFFERVEGKIRLDDNMPVADRILSVCGSRLSVTNAIAGDGKLTVEGVAACNVVYSAEDGVKSSAAVELPFSITVSAPLKSGDSVMASGIVTAVTVKLRRDGELELKADIAVEYRASRAETKYVIDELTVGEERSIPTGAVAIHIARKGETLWEAAKALGTTPENVLLQNPGISLPLSGGERVITYRQLAK